MRLYFRHFVVTVVLVSALILGSGLTKSQAIRQLVLAYVQNSHFNPVVIDDAFSRHVFDLYLERLDPGKRFFVQSDIDKLQRFRETIDSELKSNSTYLMTEATQILKERTTQVGRWYPDILNTPFSFSSKGVIETDPDKREYPANVLDLKLYWQSAIKHQVLSQYLTLYEAQVSSNNVVQKSPYRVDSKLEQKAREKVRNNLDLMFQRMLDEDPQDQFSVYMDAVLNIFDAHTSYFPPAKKEDFDISISGKLEGIGAVLKEDDGYIKVVRIVPGSASWRQGELKADDIILKVGQGAEDPVDIVGVRVRDAVKLIRGKKGDEVRLTVKKPSGKVSIIPIIRDVVVIEATYAKAGVVSDQRFSRKFGYIYLPKFYRDFEDKNGRNTTDDVKRLLVLLQESGVEGIVLDLRNNEGGALFDAIRTAGLFIESGPVVQVRGRVRQSFQVQIYKDEDKSVSYAGPLVILHNMYSASASEILAAALQDYGRAIIVGSDHSFGKGTVQTFVPLDNYMQFSTLFKPMGSLKLTIQKFYRINGDSTQYKGVVSDVILPNNQATMEVGERHLERSLPWDTVDPASYTSLSTSLPLDQLRKNSQKRIDNSERFDVLRQHFSFVKSQREKTKLPLSLKEAYDLRKHIDKQTKAYNDRQVTMNHLSVAQVKDPLTKQSDDSVINDWEQGLMKDIYLDEALAILNDLIETQKD